MASIRRHPLVNNEIYHICCRGVEKRDIFLDKGDYLRFIHDLYEFNDIENVPSSNIRLNKRKPSTANSFDFEACLDLRGPNIEKNKKEKKPIVEILAYCAMPNHFHLMIRQLVDGGVTKFMRKLNGGYVKYFNLKYDRVGPLFQGKFKSILVNTDSHFYYLPIYIHFNPLDLKFPEWRKGFIEDNEESLRYLKGYRWSSFQDYIGQKNFPSIIKKDFLETSLGNPDKYRKSMIEWLKNLKENYKKGQKQIKQKEQKTTEAPFDLMNYEGLLLE
ncbi:MAG: hypothetical protein US50_C0058G0002 [Candidatus Nomurabacteria bacterium GW2011_GWB1_37_5]|uniref:Transposase IS200-like domain-containing protein n=1 Tax=Candidatus Nomurabacteria bacterium GW2011_GWB1_37_5 TaxID=1618742 RepID=A0A0G0H6P7_9BACT|nr:MAG: hypothetical protein US50_C0058G0002 [Candidatus Nomurabacteria bacterium GW2011_GWB1_37_5]